MNRKKSFSPARVMEVHGFIYDLILRTCRLSKKKQLKYLSRIECILKSPKVQFKCLEKLLGNLTYAAWIAPFGRPFLSVLSEKIKPSKHPTPITVTSSMQNALSILKLKIKKRKDLTFDFILGRLPRAKTSNSSTRQPILAVGAWLVVISLC